MSLFDFKYTYRAMIIDGFHNKNIKTNCFVRITLLFEDNNCHSRHNICFKNSCALTLISCCTTRSNFCFRASKHISSCTRRLSSVPLTYGKHEVCWFVRNFFNKFRTWNGRKTLFFPAISSISSSCPMKWIFLPS